MNVIRRFLTRHTVALPGKHCTRQSSGLPSALITRDKMKSVRVVIIGDPNVGKSTLLNSLLKQEISAVTRYRQTTQQSAVGVITDDDTQVVFVDTPGILPGEYKHSAKVWRRNHFFEFHNKIEQCVLEAECIIYLLDCSQAAYKHYIPVEVAKLFEKNPGIPKLLVLNKIDKKQERMKFEQIVAQLTSPLPEYPVPAVATRTDIQPPDGMFQNKYCHGLEFQDVLSISALRGTHLEYLWHAVKQCAVCRPWQYEPDTVSPDSIEDIVCNIVRAEILKKCGGTIGYPLKQKFVGYKEDEDGILIEHIIFLYCSIFTSSEDREDTLQFLTQKLEARFGVKVRLELRYNYYKHEAAVMRHVEVDTAPSIEVVYK